jgi:hypothetical protein
MFQSIWPSSGVNCCGREAALFHFGLGLIFSKSHFFITVYLGNEPLPLCVMIAEKSFKVSREMACQ